MKKLLTPLLALLLLISFSATAQKAPTANLPAGKAGDISHPSGKIAYIKEGDLWVMKWDGSNRFKVVTAQNAEGKVSWAPDGRRIAFTRQGMVQLRGPDFLGGQHKVYDIFIGYLDSAEAKRTDFWYRVTNEMGGKFPEWSDDGSKIIFTFDRNANFVNSILPNYQTAWVDPNGSPTHLFAEDADSTYLSVLMPTMGENNQYSFVLFNKFTPMGIGISSFDNKKFKLSDIGEKVKMISGATAPAFSPDGKWLAYILTDMTKQGIYITKPDLSEQYLVYKPATGLNMQTYPLSWSPNSKWITFGLSDGTIWIIDITGNGLKQLVGAGEHTSPAWSKGE